jgi:protease III
LTELGKENYETVYNFVIDYISSLKASQLIYEEMAETDAIAFKFKEKSRNFDYVTMLSATMQEKPLTEVLNWKYEYAEYNSEIIDNFLKQLTP